jgi:hypothetical protein
MASQSHRICVADSSSCRRLSQVGSSVSPSTAETLLRLIRHLQKTIFLTAKPKHYIMYQPGTEIGSVANTQTGLSLQLHVKRWGGGKLLYWIDKNQNQIFHLLSYISGSISNRNLYSSFTDETWGWTDRCHHIMHSYYSLGVRNAQHTKGAPSDSTLHSALSYCGALWM